MALVLDVRGRQYTPGTCSCLHSTYGTCTRLALALDVRNGTVDLYRVTLSIWSHKIDRNQIDRNNKLHSLATMAIDRGITSFNRRQQSTHSPHLVQSVVPLLRTSKSEDTHFKSEGLASESPPEYRHTRKRLLLRVATGELFRPWLFALRRSDFPLLLNNVEDTYLSCCSPHTLVSASSSC